MVELKACPVPWCNTDERPYVWQGPDDKYCIICSGCRVEGPYCDTAEEAEEAWATRPAVPEKAAATNEALVDALKVENARLSEVAGGPVNQCQIPEVAAMGYIEELRREEGDCVTILCNIPDDFNGDYNVAIDCNGRWTEWHGRRFAGESVLQCLAKAVTDRNKLDARAVHNGAHQ